MAIGHRLYPMPCMALIDPGQYRSRPSGLCRGGVPGAIFTGGQTGPLAEGAKEYAGFGVAQQQGNFGGGQAVFAQVLFGQLAAGVSEQLLVTAAFFGEAPLQGALAQVQLARDLATIRFAMRQLLAEQADDPGTQAGA